MSELIERVARAIAESHSGRDWPRMSEYGKDWWRDEARAAISVVREWISVKDRLPDLGKVVIVCYPSGHDGKPIYAWGARLDDDDGWLWGVQTGHGGGVRLNRDAAWNSIEADDDYPVQFWRELDEPPTVSPSVVGSPPTGERT